nr:DUF6048 family protein [Fulvivirga imtechensis]
MSALRLSQKCSSRQLYGTPAFRDFDPPFGGNVFLKPHRIFLQTLANILLLFVATSGFCQEAGELKIPIDSLKGKFVPTGIRIGAEAVNITRSFIGEDYKEYQFQADIDFYRYFFNVEYGILERTFTSENGLYNVEGSYLRIGPDINFLHRDPDMSALFFGLRYGMATFSDKLNYSYRDKAFGDGTGQVANNDINAKWFEMVAGMKVKMWRMVWLGYTARFKFGVDTFENNELIPNIIPGFGRADETVVWGLNYYLIIRIPVRKEPRSIVLPAKTN